MKFPPKTRGKNKIDIDINFQILFYQKIIYYNQNVFAGNYEGWIAPIAIFQGGYS